MRLHNLYVTWNASPVPSGIYLRWFDGAIWQSLGNSMMLFGLSGNTGNTSWRNAVDVHGPPIVSWQEVGAREVYVREYQSGSSNWVELAGSAGGNGASQTPSPSFGPGKIQRDRLGRPWVVFLDLETTFGEIYARRFESSWVEVDGSGSGGGISNSEATPNNHDFTVGTNRACVAWNEIGSQSQMILVRCHAL